MTSAGVDRIDIGRANTEWGGLATNFDTNVARFAAGLRGRVFDDWRWDFYVQVGDTKSEQRTVGSRVSNFLAAQYAVRDASGAIVCGPLASNPNFAPSRLAASIDPNLVTPGCAPFNPFGVGAPSQAAIDYVSGIEATDVSIRQDVAAINLSGSPLSTLAGPVDVAAGFEIRRDKLSQVADPLQILGIYSTLNAKSYGGENTVTEGYLEFGLPLLRDAPFAKSLDFNAAVRRANYETSGLVTTWKAGVSWELNDTLRLRLMQSRDIRAPSLNELFSIGGVTSSGIFYVNPFTNVSSRLANTASGNPNLRPEVADTFTAGVIAQPRWGWTAGLRLSIDYYSIELKDVIASTTAIDVLTRCYAGLQDYCAAIQFDSTPFGVRNISISPLNQAVQRTNGVDFELAYRVPEAIVPGRLNIRALATYVDDLERVDRGGGDTLVTSDTAGSAGAPGTPGVPTWSGDVFIDYRFEPVTLGVQLRTFAPLKYDNKLFGPDDGARYNPASSDSINITRFPSLAYVNLNAAYDVGKKFQLFGVISNLLDQDPPYLSLAAINSGGNPYDWVGRSAKLGVRFDW